MFFYDFISLSNRFQYLKEILYIHISAHLYFCISIFVDIYIYNKNPWCITAAEES